MAVTFTVDDNSYTFVASIEKELDPYRDQSLIAEAIKDIARAYAEQWLVEHLDEVFAGINAKALSNAILLDASKIVAERIASQK